MNDELLFAAIALRDDMLMRAKMSTYLNNDEIVVEAGKSIWFRFNEAINNSQKD